MATIVSLLIGPIGSTIRNSLWKIVKIKNREMSVWAKFAKISSRENFYLYSIRNITIIVTHGCSHCKVTKYRIHMKYRILLEKLTNSSKSNITAILFNHGNFFTILSSQYSQNIYQWEKNSYQWKLANNKNTKLQQVPCFEWYLGNVCLFHSDETIQQFKILIFQWAKDTFHKLLI